MALGVAARSDGTAFVAGKAIVAGASYGLVMRISPSGEWDSTSNGSMLYRFLGGTNGNTVINDIALDPTDVFSDLHVHVAGDTSATDFPLVNAAQGAYGGGASDGFVTRLGPTLSPERSTYIGGAGADHVAAVAVPQGLTDDTFVAGYTTSATGFPLANAYQGTYGGGVDAFVARFGSSQFVFSTFLGGSGADAALDLAAGSSLYVTGSSSSTTFPRFPTNSTPPNACTDSTDAFVTRMTLTGNALEYSGCLGGSGLDMGSGIAIDASGNAYITGYTASTNFPLTNPAQSTYGGNGDAFVAKLSTNSPYAIAYSTYLGGSGLEGALVIEGSGPKIAVNSLGNAIITGDTASGNSGPGGFPTFRPLTDPVSALGGVDIFITKLAPSGSPKIFSTLFGGTDLEAPLAIAVDAAGNAIIAGVTHSEASWPLRSGPGRGVENCTNGIDDNANGRIDCADADCVHPGGPCEICGDGIDNDGNGGADCADPAYVCQLDGQCSDGVAGDMDLFVLSIGDDACAGVTCNDSNGCTTDSCDPATGQCVFAANTSACNDGVYCNGTDTCSAGSCSVHAGSPCPGADGDSNCAESCNEVADNCTAADSNGSACNDGTFCDGTDSCLSGACSVHSGSPCPGADGDGNCSETCDEVADNCSGADPNGSSCNDGAFCNGTDSCSSGACSTHTGSPCPGADGDGNCAETCNEAADNCTAADPNGSACNDGTFCDGTDSCLSGACSVHSGSPCPGADGDGNCAETCDEVADDCSGADPNGTSCDDGAFCDGTDTCSSGACAHSGNPCTAGGPCMLCDESVDACQDNDPDGDDVCTPDDNCPVEFNPDQLNSDCSDSMFFPLGGCTDPNLVPDLLRGCCDGGDVCDVCPANRNNERCDPNLSGGQSIGAAGGTFTLGNCLTITIPPGALATDTSISVSTGEDEPINPVSGQPFGDAIKLKGAQTSVHKIVMLPDNQTFAVPILIDMCWADRDNDNVVDKGVCLDNPPCTETPGLTCDADGDCNCGKCLAGGNLQEDNLRLRRDAAIFDRLGFHGAPQAQCSDVEQQNPALCGATAAIANCSNAPGTGASSVANCCDRTGNRWPMHTCYFSEYYFGRAEGALIPGRGSMLTDCMAEWSVTNPFNDREYDKRGFVNFDQSCTDGDPTCDTDGVADGVCTFQVAICLNVNDSRLTNINGAQTCTNDRVTAWEIMKPSPASPKPERAAAAIALRDAMLAFGGTVEGVQQNRVQFVSPLDAELSCIDATEIRVPLVGPASDRRAVMVFKTTTTGVTNAPAAETADPDLLKLTCNPSAR